MPTQPRWPPSVFATCRAMLAICSRLVASVARGMKDLHAGPVRREREGAIVARKTGAAVAAARHQVLGADARIAAEDGRHTVHVDSADPFRNHAQHVGERNLGGHEGIDGDLGQLRFAGVHAMDGRAVSDHGAVEGLEHRAGAPVAFSDHNEVRMEEVSDDAS